MFKNKFLFALTVAFLFDINVINGATMQKKMTVKEKKQRFFSMVLPAINQVYDELEQQYNKTKILIEQNPNSTQIKNLMQDYSAKDPQDLLIRLKPHPKSIALAQAAIESAWGTSRFFRVANNVFGVWSFNADEPRVAASQKRGSTTIYVKKYNSILHSTRDYYKVLATGKAFEDFRIKKVQTNNPQILVKYLKKYSEMGGLYDKELSSMIRYNKLTKYDY